MNPVDPKQEVKDAIKRQIVKWSVFGVVVSLLPFAIDFGQYWLDGSPVTLATIIGSGQLLLVAVALTGGGIGEVFFCQHKWNWRRILAGCGAFVIFLLCAFFYPVASKASEESKAPASARNATQTPPSTVEQNRGRTNPKATDIPPDSKADRVSRLSIILFVAAWITAGGCVISSELK